MKILALDLSTNTGWACGPIDGPPVHGRFSLPKTGKDIGAYATAFQDELCSLLGKHAPDRVCFESPIMIGQRTSIHAARKLYGLAYHTELICKVWGIPCSETHMQTARSTLGVKGLARTRVDSQGIKHAVTPEERRKHIKAEVMRLCRAMGWEPANDDEADALCIWHDACHQFGKLRLAFS